MSLINPQDALERIADHTSEVKNSLRKLNRRDAWHWWNAVLVIMLLMGAIVALSLPQMSLADDPTFQLQLTLAVRGLLGLVLIFNVYTLYQQHLLRQLRNHLAEQVEIATQSKARAETLYELAIIDPLTGLYNRRFSEERIKTEIHRATRKGFPLLAILFDLDQFKQVNDQLGHPAGDAVLKEFAHRVNRAIRGSDFAVRMGGDEFLVVLPECSAENVQSVLDRLVPFEIDLEGRRVRVASSQGWARYENGETVEEFIKRVDRALYEDKAKRHASNGRPESESSEEKLVTQGQTREPRSASFG